MYGKREINRFNKIKRIYFENLTKFGFKLSQINSDFEKLNIQEGNNQELNDFIWYRLNLALSKFPNDLEKQFFIYLEQKSFLIDTKFTGDRVYLDKLLFKTKKEIDYKSANANRSIKLQFVVIGRNDSCEVCRSENGKVYDIDYFYKNYNLPHEGCNCENGCTCWFGLVGIRDNDGRLIFVDDEPIKPVIKDYKKEGSSLILKTLKFLKLIK